MGDRTTKIVLVLLLILTFFVLTRCDFGPPKPRPDLDLTQAQQMPVTALVPKELQWPAKNTFVGQQDATPVAGPIDTTRALSEDEITYTYLGPGHFGAFTTGEYANGQRVLWSNGVNGLYKLDHDTYEIIDHLESAVADKYPESWANERTDGLDKRNGVTGIRNAINAVTALRDLTGVYIVVGNNNWVYIANKDGTIRAYGDEIDGDPNSKIVEKGRYQLPKELAGPTVGMNMTYDGWIVLPTENGYMIAVNMDLTDSRIVQMKYADTEDTTSQGVGYGWVRNSIAVDEDGGIYVPSRNHMHKVVWTGDDFSIDEKDGAWVAEYRNGQGNGSGATPSLMGFGEEDQFVVITDGDDRMNVTLMWRNEIPENWQQLEGAPSRRIAGLAPVTMGELDVQKIQSEQTVVVAGYGALVVNNTPRNPPFFLPEEGRARGILVGPLGNNPKFQPYGVQKFEWDPVAKELKSAWVNEDVSSPNGVPWTSIGSGQVYFIGARNHKWTLEALDWYTGKETFHYIIGGQKYNSQYSGVNMDEKGRVYYGTMFGRARIEAGVDLAEKK